MAAGLEVEAVVGSDTVGPGTQELARSGVAQPPPRASGNVSVDLGRELADRNA